VTAGKVLTYALPSYSDIDGDEVNVTADMGVAKSFVTFTKNIFQIMPPTIAKNMTYVIIIHLEDS
jgi:hypothetical protein